MKHMNLFERILRRFGFVRIRKIESVAEIPGTLPDGAARKAPCEIVSLPEIRISSPDAQDALVLRSVDYGTLPPNRSVIRLGEHQKKAVRSSLSSAAGIGANVGGQATVVGGLYRATASASQLMQYSNGTVSSIVVEGGQIVGHAGFTAAGAAALAPVAIFSVLATVTGQYYMKDIQKQLNQLNTTLQQILQKIEAEKRGSLDAIYDYLQIIEKQKVFSIDDLVFIRMQSANALAIYYNYVEQLKVYLSDESIGRMMEKDSAFEYKNVKKTRENIEKNDLLYLVDMANTSYALHSLSELMYFKEVCLMSGKDPLYLEKVSEGLRTLSASRPMEHLERIEALERNLLPYLHKKADEAVAWQENIASNREPLEELVRKLKGSTEKMDTSVRTLKEDFVRPFNENRNIFYDLSNPDDPAIFIEA